MARSYAMKHVRTAIMLAGAFATGAFVSRLPERAAAATAPVSAMSVDLNALSADNFAPTPLLPNLRQKLIAVVDSTAISFAIGTAPKHTHAATTEIQVVMGGAGTEWLGDKQIPIAPGTLLIIPPNTPHGGLTGGPFRLLTMKTPPQDPSDYHMLP